MEQPLVSIIMPVYNAGRYLKEAIEAALTQTWPNKELIIINDGSSDGSLEIAEAFKRENVKIISQQNQGASAARNQGLKTAKGDYIQFLDADDLLSPDKIERQLAKLNGQTAILAVGPSLHFMDGTDPFSQSPVHEWYRTGTNDPADFLTKLYGGSLIGPEYGGMVPLHAWLIPAKLIQLAGPWNEALSLDDDGEFMARVILASNGFVYAEEGTSYYRKYITNQNISSQTSFEAHQSLLTSTKLRKQYLLEKKNDQHARTALSRIFGEIAVSFYPEFPALTNEAEQIARGLDPSVKPQPFTVFPSKHIAKVIGWRGMKRLSRLKQKWTKRI